MLLVLNEIKSTLLRKTIIVKLYTNLPVKTVSTNYISGSPLKRGVTLSHIFTIFFYKNIIISLSELLQRHHCDFIRMCRVHFNFKSSGFSLALSGGHYSQPCELGHTRSGRMARLFVARGQEFH